MKYDILCSTSSTSVFWSKLKIMEGIREATLSTKRSAVYTSIKYIYILYLALVFVTLPFKNYGWTLWGQIRRPSISGPTIFIWSVIVKLSEAIYLMSCVCNDAVLFNESLNQSCPLNSLSEHLEKLETQLSTAAGGSDKQVQVILFLK